MPTPITKDGYEKKKAELDQLERVEKPRITQAIAEARAEGDLRENAEYHAQRKASAFSKTASVVCAANLPTASLWTRIRYPKTESYSDGW